MHSTRTARLRLIGKQIVITNYYSRLWIDINSTILFDLLTR